MFIDLYAKEANDSFFQTDGAELLLDLGVSASLVGKCRDIDWNDGCYDRL